MATKLKDLTEPTLFKIRGRNYFSSNRKSKDFKSVWCLDIKSGQLVSIADDDEIEPADYKLHENAR